MPRYLCLHVQTESQADIDLAGGASPPENCPSKDFVQSQDGSQCVCKPGYFAITDTTCAPCEAGYRCPNGVKEQCPIHYYQPRTGATDCIPCSSTGTALGFFSACGVRGYQLRFCDPDVPGTQDKALSTQCIPCNQCRRPYVSGGDTLLSDCYRDN
jgi:hypothetical protein